ncbi:MAG: hypothetical protein RLZZ519_3344 [Bacteroidota bacterium]|jgi:hypothetical protein
MDVDNYCRIGTERNGFEAECMMIVFLQAWNSE